MTLSRNPKSFSQLELNNCRISMPMTFQQGRGHFYFNYASNFPSFKFKAMLLGDGSGSGIALPSNGQNRNWQIKDLLDNTDRSFVSQETDNTEPFGVKCKQLHTGVSRKPFPPLSGAILKAIRFVSIPNSRWGGCGYPSRSACHTAVVVWPRHWGNNKNNNNNTSMPDIHTRSQVTYTVS